MLRLLRQKKVRDALAALALLIATAALVISPGEAINGAKDGLALCFNVIVPSLFPFFVLSSLVVDLGLAAYLGRAMEGLMRPLFRVSGSCAAAVALGFIGGYPVGARTALQLYEQGLCSKTEAERLLAFCNNSGPAFILGVVGAGVFGSVRAGVWLWLIHIFAALLTGLAFRRSGESGPPQYVTRNSPSRGPSLFAALVEAVRGGLTGMLSVCAFVIFFYVLASPLATLGGRLGPLLVGLTELFSLTPLLPADGFGFVLAAGCAGWGGLSVLCQTAAVLDGSGLRLRSCLAGKLLQGLLSAGLALALRGYVLG